MVPSTVSVSPAANPAVNSSPPVPDSLVFVVIVAPKLFDTAVPVVVASVNPVAGVVSGLPVKSRALRPPRALIVPLAAVALTAVVGVDGRLAAYLIEVVVWAGMKLFWN